MTSSLRNSILLLLGVLVLSAMAIRAKPFAEEELPGSFNYLTKYRTFSEQPRDNKISILMRLAYWKSKHFASSTASQDGATILDVSTDYYSNMYDDQVLMSLCPNNLQTICQLAVQTALRNYPEKLFDLVTAIRLRPDRVRAERVLLHKLLESTIMSVEHYNLDKHLSSAIDLAASKNPFVLVASRALDIILSRVMKPESKNAPNT